MPDNNIETNGGSYVLGNVEVGDNFIGRDQIILGDLVCGNKYTESNMQTLQRDLLGFAQGWYNDIIERLQLQLNQQKSEYDERDFLIVLDFNYLWRRDYLPQIVAIRRSLLVNHSDLGHVIREIDLFLKILVEEQSLVRYKPILDWFNSAA